MLSGFPDSDLRIRFPLSILIFSVYVPGFTIITSPGLELFIAFCIELPGLTIIFAAFPTPDIDNKIVRVKIKVINLFILIPPSVRKIFPNN